MADRRPRPDPYAVLGINRDASSADISRAYRRLARVLHPDYRPGDSDTADRFRAVTAAHELLSDPARRAAHDQHDRHRLVSPPREATSDTSWSRAASQVRPLGPVDASPWMVTPPASAAVRPGPVSIEPSPDRTHAAHEAATRIAELLQLIRQQGGDQWYWTW
jgi:curved DNA-binding protein CbpA